MNLLSEGDTILIATHNAGKAQEFRDMLLPLGIKVSTGAEYNLIEPAETGVTFRENAAIKALSAARVAGIPALADDSGICVNALNGEPGVFTADWAVTPQGRDFGMAMERVEHFLAGKTDRSAYFICCLALAFPNGNVQYFEGRTDGTLVWPVRGAHGFGFDPMFMPDGHAKTFAEMPKEEKNKISHRGKALQNFLKTLQA